jgi:hypothetical protein
VKRKQAATSYQIEPFGKDINLPRCGRVALPGEHLLCKQNNSHGKSLPGLRLGEQSVPLVAPTLLQNMATLGESLVLCDSERILAPSVNRVG